MTRPPTRSPVAALVLAVLPASAAWSAQPTMVTVDTAPARTRYRVSRPGSRDLAVPSYRSGGFTQRARPLRDGGTEVTVVVEPTAIRAATAWPAPSASRDRETRRWMRVTQADSDPRLAALAEELAAEARLEVEASERILAWVSASVEQVDRPEHADTAVATLESGRGSCVGRSRLAVALLRHAGIPARTVHGLVVPHGVPARGLLGSADFVLHRFVESHLVDAGWVLSDPGESIHLVDTRHVVLATDEEHYDPEAQRHLRIAPMSDVGALKVAGRWKGGATSLAFRLAVPAVRPAP